MLTRAILLVSLIIPLLLCPISHINSSSRSSLNLNSCLRLSPIGMTFSLSVDLFTLAIFSFGLFLPRRKHASLFFYFPITTVFFPTLHSGTPPRRTDMQEASSSTLPLPPSLPSFPLKACHSHKARTQPGQTRARSLPP